MCMSPTSLAHPISRPSDSIVHTTTCLGQTTATACKRTAGTDAHSVPDAGQHRPYLGGGDGFPQEVSCVAARPPRELHHDEWQPAPAWVAAAGGAGRRSAKNADRPINQSREAHHPAWPLHSPEGPCHRNHWNGLKAWC